MIFYIKNYGKKLGNFYFYKFYIFGDRHMNIQKIQFNSLYHRTNTYNKQNYATISNNNFELPKGENYISFKAFSPIQKLNAIGKDNFPSPIIYEKYKTAVEKGENPSLYEIHMEHYSPLLHCKTLDEAKKLYPEFSDVIDAKDIPFDNKISILKRIDQGKFEGAKTEKLSLQLLKKYYVQLAGLGNRDVYYNIDPHPASDMLTALNIKKLNKTYRSSCVNESPEMVQKMSEGQKMTWKKSESRRKNHAEFLERMWNDPNYVEKQSAQMKRRLAETDLAERKAQGLREYWADDSRGIENKKAVLARLLVYATSPEAAKKTSQRNKKNWQNPKYREREIQQVREQWQKPEHRKYMSEVMKAHWQDPDYVARMEIYKKALQEAWKLHPDFSQKMKEIVHDFGRGITVLIKKSENGEPLTEAEKKLLSSYYKECHEQMPDFTKIVGQDAHRLLVEWGVLPPDDEE